MRIIDILCPNAIEVYLKSTTKTAVINELVDLLSVPSSDKKNHLNITEIKQSVLDREKLSSTGICNGLAIPHAKVSGTKQIMAGIGLSKEGIDFDSMDKLKSKIFFILISPKEDDGNHVKILARITRILKDDKSRSELLHCQTKGEIFEFIKTKEEEVIKK